MEQNLTRVGIIGVSGYGGGELVRLLSQHPHVSLTYITSHTYEGKPLASSHFGAAKRVDMVCEAYDFDKAVALCDVLFLAGEAGLAMKIAPPLLAAGKKIIDLSGDFRLKDPAAYQAWYKIEHTATDALKDAVLCLPEINRQDARGAKLIANPGCYPTTVVLALSPLIKSGLIDVHSLIIDSISGVSGAGRSKFGPDTHFSELNESLKPYGAGGVHKHVPEIEQMLSALAGQELRVTFTPHLAPVTRGILTTAYANLLPEAKGTTGAALTKMYQEHYAHEPFVVVSEEKTYPATKHTLGSNSCHIGVTVDARTGRVIVFAAQDNLVKGMAGQAVQNMNLICGYEETTGLMMCGLWP